MTTTTTTTTPPPAPPPQKKGGLFSSLRNLVGAKPLERSDVEPLMETPD